MSNLLNYCRLLTRLAAGFGAAAALLILVPNEATAGVVSAGYTELVQGTAINLTTTGNIDWVKWGNSTASSSTFSTVEKVGGTIINPTLTPLGTAPAGFSVQLGTFALGPATTGALEFSWTDGTAAPAGGFPTNDSLVSQFLSPGAFSYPIGLGFFFTANASAIEQVLDVYVQGFNADMLLSATMSGGGSASAVVTPSKNPPFDSGNDYSIGRFRVTFSGAGETLTISAITQDPRTDGNLQQFANAGVFAAAIGTPSNEPVPEPASLTLVAIGIALAGAARAGRGYSMLSRCLRNQASAARR